MMYSEPASAGSLNWLAEMASAAAAPVVTELIVTFHSSLAISVPIGAGLSRVPTVADSSDEVASSVACSSLTELSFTVVSPLEKAWLNELATTAKNTIAPTIVPTTETTIAVIACHFVSFRKTATMPRMKAIGSRSHPTMSAPGMHAKMNPTMAMIMATRPRVFRAGFSVGVPGGAYAGGAA